MAAIHKFAATEDADPPDDPPGTRSLVFSSLDFKGFITLPKKLVVLAEPIANSSIFVFPRITAPSLIKLFETVDS